MNDWPETNPSLILRIKDPQNAVAWNELIAIYRPVIYRLARRKGLLHEDAEDLVQGVFMSVAKAIDRWEHGEGQPRFRNWPQLQVPIGLGAVVLVATFLLAGIRWSSLFNSIVVSITLTALALFVIAGLATLLRSSQGPSEAIDVAPPIDVTFGGFLEACALMFVAYTGYGRIATLGEEIRDPKRNIPIAIITTLAVSMALYVSVAWVSISVSSPELLAVATKSQAAPLEIVAQQFTHPEARYVIAVGAVTSMLGVLINLVLGLSRVALAMGRRGDLPKGFARLDQSGRTAPTAVIGVSVLIAVLIAIGNVKTTWSFSAFTVLIYYAITNMAAIKMSNAERRYPRVIAWLGMISCLFLAFWVELMVWVAGLGLIAIGLFWWRLFPVFDKSRF